MATIAGSVKSLSTGVFNVKDENGNVRALKVGDEIYENDTVYGENGNSSSSQVEIQLSGNDVIVLNAGQKQLIDSSLIETAFGTEELFFTRDSLDLKADNYNSNADVVSDLRDAEFTGEKKESEQDGTFADANNADATKEETAEGEEEVEDETAGTGEFQARTGAATDINSDLRNAQFRARTQTFREVERNDDLLEMNSKNLGERSNAFDTSNPFTPTTSIIPSAGNQTPGTPTRPESSGPTENVEPPVISIVTPPTVIVTPPTVIVTPPTIPNLSVNDVKAYESEGFLIFTVTLDKPNSSDVTFDYVTSPLTATNGGVDYTDIKGKITIPAGSTTVTIKVPITDDYISDNGETMKIDISNVQGDVNVPKPTGIGTILDDPANEDSIYAIIVGPGVVIEGNTTTEYTVKLIDKDGNPVTVTKETDVTVIYKNITTQDGDTVYNNGSTITVKIPANSSSNTFTVATIDDYIADNGENYNLEITKVEDTGEFEKIVVGDKNGNFKYVTTTILDDSQPNTPNNPNDPVEPNMESVVVKLVSTDAQGNIIPEATIAEGATAYYKAILVDPSGNQIVGATGTVAITFTDGTAIRTGTTTNGTDDFTATNQTVALNTVFSAVSKDDYIADSGEKFNVQITDKTYSNASAYENVIHITTPIVTTITDNSKNTPNNPFDETNTPPVEADLDIITVKLFAISEIDGSRTQVNSVVEGNSAEYIAIAFDPDGNEILAGETIKVTFGKSGDSATANVDYNATTQTVTLGTKFSTPTIDDYIADNGEKFSIQLVDATLSNANKYETVLIDTTSVTTTILDNSKPDGNTPHNPNENPKTVEPNAEVVKIKLVALDEAGKPIFAADGKTYTFANDVNEGNNAKYMALAFAPNAIVFTTDTVLLDQIGTVDVTFADTTNATLNATGSTTGTLTNGTQDYNNTAQAKVALGTVITTKTFDDWKADNGETFTISITNKSYAANASGGYENVTIDTKVVTTTILDDSRGTPATPGNPEVPAVPHNPNTPPPLNTTPPTPQHPETNHEIVQIKLVACDKNGNPILVDDGNGNITKYVFANNVPEDNEAFYMAIAFTPGATTYTTATKLADADQLGSVTVSTKDLNPLEAKGISGAQTITPLKNKHKLIN